MGKKNKFLLVSLQDQKAAELAQVISNSTCRRILDYLSEHDSITESQVSQDLAVPLPTVHYNLQLLVKGGLVKIEEFHYSVKGKEVNHYSLANQYIIIAPKGVHGFKEKLRSILPVVLAAVGVTALLQWLSRYLPVIQTMKENVFTESIPAAQNLIQQASQDVASAQPVLEEAVREVESIVADTAEQATPEIARTSSSQIIENTTPIVTKETIVQTITTEPSFWHSIAVWFLIGALFAVAVYLIVDTIRKK